MSPVSKERRRSARRPVLDSFSFFVVAPKRGPHRLKVHDLSDEGLLFDFDLPGENPDDFPVDIGEVLDLEFYVNPTLAIALQARVIRTDKPSKKNAVRHIGAEIVAVKGAANQAIRNLVELIDTLSQLSSK